jgi:hypothetical protein
MSPRHLVTALGAVLVIGVLGACRPPAAALTIDVAETGEATLAITDEALLGEVDTLLALMYFNHEGANSCSALVDESVQALTGRGPLARQALATTGPDATLDHSFGNIGASGEHSFLLLGSFRPSRDFRGGASCSVNTDCASGSCVRSVCARADDPLELAAGNVVAVGCEEFFVVQNFRAELPIRLFPTGLR